MSEIVTRLTGILIEDDNILLLKQDTDGKRKWSLPGGKLEFGETMEDGLIREMKEETGLDVAMARLLYVTDFFPTPDKHILHTTFEVTRIGGELGKDISQADTNKIHSVEFIPIKDLCDYGFSETFRDVVLQGFPASGNYMRDKANIGLAESKKNSNDNFKLAI